MSTLLVSKARFRRLSGANRTRRLSGREIANALIDAELVPISRIVGSYDVPPYAELTIYLFTFLHV